MKYPGKELEIFDNATFFQKYIYFKIKRFLKNEILEVGAGIGSFTRNYQERFTKVCLTDLDEKNYSTLKKKYADKSNIQVNNKKIGEIDGNFNTIIYLNVLEHIEKDQKEIEHALSKLNKNGHLIVLVPAHQKLYSKFDNAIGHCRRYEINFFKNTKFKDVQIVKLFYLDIVGYLLYFLNKLFFSEEVYPSKAKILLWDKIFAPITILLDFITCYKFGKNILCVYKKTG